MMKKEKVKEGVIGTLLKYLYDVAHEMTLQVVIQ